jgi:photosystem II stability/assembly factor-like uncharacterized protein
MINYFYFSKIRAFFIARILIFVLFCLVGSVDLIFAQQKYEVLFDSKNEASTLQLFDISCSNDKNCTAIGYIDETGVQPPYRVYIIRTTDGGKTWVSQQSGLPGRFSNNDAYLKKVYAIDSLNIVAVGDSGLILRTINGGVSWVSQNGNTLNKLLDVSFLDSSNGLIAGGGGLLLSTSDAGATWVSIPALPLKLLSSCKMFSKDDQAVLEYGYGPIIYTNNNWQTWDTSHLIVDSAIGGHKANCSKAFFMDKNNCIAYGNHKTTENQGNTSNCFIEKSNNGGTSWVPVFDSADSRIIFGLSTLALNKNGYGVASGAGSNGILLTTDMGLNWRSDTVDGKFDFTDLIASSFPEKDNVFFIAQTSAFGYCGIVKLQFSKLLTVESFENIKLGTHVYPNPSNNWLTIFANPYFDVTYHLYDALGRKVKDFISTSSNTRLGIADLPSGTYRLISNYQGRQISIGNVLVIHDN